MSVVDIPKVKVGMTVNGRAVSAQVEPRPSSAGAATASAASAARFRLGPSRAVPIVALAAFSACRGRSPTLVSAMAQVATRPPETVIKTAAAAVA